MDNIDSLKKEIKKLEIIIADKDKTIRSLNRKSEVNEVNYEYIEQLNNVMKLNEDLTEKLKEKELLIEKIFKTPHKLINIPSCVSCENISAESEEILKQVSKILKKKNDLILELKQKVDNLNKVIEEYIVEIDIIKNNNKDNFKNIISLSMEKIENFEFVQNKKTINNIVNQQNNSEETLSSNKNIPCINSIPGVPKVPSIPGLPKVPSIPGVPEIPSIPKVPGILNVPGIALIPNVPSPSIPGISSKPVVPGIPSIPGVPGIPSIPGVPGIPSIPGVPGIPSIPGVPGIPPKLNSNNQGSTNIPNIPGIPKSGGGIVQSKVSLGPILSSGLNESKFTKKKIQIKPIPNALLKSTYWINWNQIVEIPKFINTDIINKFFSVEKNADEKKDIRRTSIITPQVKKEVVLFDDKRSRNFTIMLSRFTISASELFRVLDTFDTNILQINEIDMIANLMPSAEEEKLLKNYKGSLNELAKPEKYLIRIIVIPRFRERVKHLEYIIKYSARVSIIRDDLTILVSCISNIMKSKYFKFVLVTCLGIANYMNGQNLMGMTIESMVAFATTNTVDKKQNLPKVLYKLFNDNTNDINTLRYDLEGLPAAINVDLDMISNDFNFLFNGLDLMKNEISALDNFLDEEKIESYKTNLIYFAADAIEELDNLSTQFEEAKKLYCQFTEKFGEKKTAKPKEILEPLFLFFKSFN